MALTTVDAGLLSSQSQQTWRSRIINGAMVISQRATTATANSTTAALGLFVADRFRAVITAGTGVFTFAQDSSLYPTGFTYSLKATVTTAYTVTGTDRYEISQLIEGYNIADLSWGTASAQTITVSFWVRSSLTGTFGGVVQNANADYNYPFSYAISAANTWEQKTVTITGPTTGTWATDNTQGLKVLWSLGCGSTRLGTAGAWSATRYEGVTGQTQLIATNGATFNITGVQLEKGSTATSFDYRPYGTELQLCQRYFQKSYDINTTPGTVTGTGANFFVADSVHGESSGSVWGLVSFRSAPTTVLYSPNTGASSAIRNVSTGADQTSVGITGASEQKAIGYIGGTRTLGSIYTYQWTASAEL